MYVNMEINPIITGKMDTNKEIQIVHLKEDRRL